MAAKACPKGKVYDTSTKTCRIKQDNPNDEDRQYGFQVQGAINAGSKDEAESILYNTLKGKVEGLSQIIIR